MHSRRNNRYAMDPIFLLEIVIVTAIIATQVWVFVRNGQQIQRLAELFPKGSQIRVQLQTKDGQSVRRLQAPAQSSAEFQEIVTHSNAYLEKNPGAVRFVPLKEIAQARSESLSQAVEANLPLPLYIGLLCTFTGVIIGLVKIAFVGVTDAAIQSFIGGVLIGMIGSAAGLAMTTRSNFSYKNGRQEKDERLEGYLELLRREVVAQESTPALGGIQGLREQLAAFHEGFSQYQEYVNRSLGDTVRLFRDLKEAFQQIQAVEQGLQGIGRTLQANDSMISRQENFLNDYVQRTEDLSRKLSDRLALVDQKTNQVVDRQLEQIDASTQAAYQKMDRYLASIEDGDRKQAAEKLGQDLGSLRSEVQGLQARNVELNQQLAQALTQAHTREAHLAQELSALRQSWESGAGRSFVDSFGFRLFAIAGTVASVLAIAGGSMYILNTFFQ